MIGGQYLDITRRRRRPGGAAPAEDRLPVLGLGRVRALGGRGAGVASRSPWRAFADEVGLLFQIVDDILDEDGYVLEHGAEGARALADEAAERARRRAVARSDADT